VVCLRRLSDDNYAMGLRLRHGVRRQLLLLPVRGGSVEADFALGNLRLTLGVFQDNQAITAFV
jgi:hypothetical protein